MRIKISNPSQKRSRAARAFTLLEVMIAAGIFFMAIFAILELVSTNIRYARLLQEPIVSGGMLLGDLSLTNKFYEGSDSGDFGEAFPGYHWTSDIEQIGSNGWFQATFIVTKQNSDYGKHLDQVITGQFYRPDSPAGAAFSQ